MHRVLWLRSSPSQQTPNISIFIHNYIRIKHTKLPRKHKIDINEVLLRHRFVHTCTQLWRIQACAYKIRCNAHHTSANLGFRRYCCCHVVSYVSHEGVKNLITSRFNEFGGITIALSAVVLWQNAARPAEFTYPSIYGSASVTQCCSVSVDAAPYCVKCIPSSFSDWLLLSASWLNGFV